MNNLILLPVRRTGKAFGVWTVSEEKREGLEYAAAYVNNEITKVFIVKDTMFIDQINKTAFDLIDITGTKLGDRVKNAVGEFNSLPNVQYKTV